MHAETTEVLAGCCPVVRKSAFCQARVSKPSLLMLESCIHDSPTNSLARL